MGKMTMEKYKEMGFINRGDGKVQDRHGDIYYPRKVEGVAKAVRQFCFECCGMDRREKTPERPYFDVENCSDPMCPLFDFRAGKNPYHGRAAKPLPSVEDQQKQVKG